MQISDGKEKFEIDVDDNQLSFLLNSNQVRSSVKDILGNRVSFSDDVPEGYETKLVYPLPAGAVLLDSGIFRTRRFIDRLELAQKLSLLEVDVKKFTIPFLHPCNIIIAGGKISIIHQGLNNIMAPSTFDEENILRSYKALILKIINPKMNYENLIDGAEGINGRFNQIVARCESIEETNQIIDKELSDALQEQRKTTVVVKRKRHQFLKIFSLASAVCLLSLGWFSYAAYVRDMPKQDAIINAQSDFVVNNYGKALSDLQKYDVGELSKPARYVLAVSSINLADLKVGQRQAILNQISIKSDDNTINYWIYLARANFDKALSLAENLGDDQLTLLAYVDYYQAVKMDSAMDGMKKQKMLDEFTKKIQDLSKRLGQG